MNRYHVHVAPNESPCNVAITVSVDARNEDEARDVAWLYCPELFITEIEAAEIEPDVTIEGGNDDCGTCGAISEHIREHGGGGYCIHHGAICRKVDL